MLKNTKYFTVKEATYSATAERGGWGNLPETEEQEKNLQDTMYKMDKVREFLGSPIVVHCAFRNTRTNAAVGGVENSFHIRGLAFDFSSPRYGPVKDVFDALKNRLTEFKIDKLIWEHNRDFSRNWIHLQVQPEGVQPRHRAFEMVV